MAVPRQGFFTIVNKFEDMISRFGRIHESDGLTDRPTDTEWRNRPRGKNAFGFYYFTINKHNLSSTKFVLNEFRPNLARRANAVPRFYF